jgi:tetratricopeptide (TPR) repeat protein
VSLASIDAGANRYALRLPPFALHSRPIDVCRFFALLSEPERQGPWHKAPNQRTGTAKGIAVDYSDAYALFRKATETANDDPRKALPLARESLRAFRWCQCFRIKSACMVGLIYSILGDHRRAERIFLVSYRVANGCRCCRPVLDRHYGLSLSLQGKHVEAIEHARRAVEAKGPDKCLRVLSLGFTYYRARDSRAASMLTNSLADFPPESTHYRQAFINLGFALAFGSKEDRSKVEALLPNLRQSLMSLRGVSVVRANLAWLEGGVYAAKAQDLSSDRRRQKSILCEARDYLEIAFGRFSRLDLREDAIATWSEMLAIQSHVDLSQLPKWLDKCEIKFQGVLARDACEAKAQILAILESVSDTSRTSKTKALNARVKILAILDTLRYESVSDPSLVL